MTEIGSDRDSSTAIMRSDMRLGEVHVLFLVEHQRVLQNIVDIIS